MSSTTSTPSAIDPRFEYPSAEDFAAWNQEVGPVVSTEPKPLPPPVIIRGRYVDIVPAAPEHFPHWYEAFGRPCPENDRLWTYMLDGPFSARINAEANASAQANGKTGDADYHAFETAMQRYLDKPTELTNFAIIPKIALGGQKARDNATAQAGESTAPPTAEGSKSTNTAQSASVQLLPPSQRRPLGRFALMRPDAANRAVEVGHVMFGREMQGTVCATEAFYLIFRYAFEGVTSSPSYAVPTEDDTASPAANGSAPAPSSPIGYRRLEWKCHSMNIPSKRAAMRLGFTYEGCFRQHLIIKGRSRDTLWFSILDGEWEAGHKEAMERWLDAGNFTIEGGSMKQKKTLAQIREEVLASKGEASQDEHAQKQVQ